ncbi:MAG: PBP1A family penicillin-binding protein [Blastocatellia bacterium]
MSDNFFLSPDDEPNGPRRGSAGSTWQDKLTDFRFRVEDFLRSATFGSLVMLTMVAGLMTGAAFACQTSISSFADDVDGLADYRPPEVTKVFADDGKTVIGELSLERRIPIESTDYKVIPEGMKQAILAIEDTRFYNHIGIDPVRLVGAVVQSLIRQRRVQGISTLTQQLARGLFLTRERSNTRKLNEAIYALQIERVYTKDQILMMYCDQIFLGGGAYGFEAGANYYFSKHLNELTLDQYAMLAALPKSHQQFSPINRQKAAKDRRNLVLQAMADAGFISEGDADAFKAKPLGLNVDDQRGKTDRSPYAYFLEEVRQELQKILVERHSQDAMEVYRAGLHVYTTLDAQAQLWAVEAVRKGARKYEQRHGWRVKFDNIIEKEGANPDTYQHSSWIAVPEVGDIMTGLVREVSDKGTKVSFGSYSATITAADTEILKRPPSKIFKRGDLAQFKIDAIDPATKILRVKLDPEPDVQAALAMVESKTGEIKAMVGGYSFATSKFNHATQANRQTGSAFKPFIYATALEQGLRPDDTVDDSPFVHGSWEPHNYDNSFMGAMPIRKAFALSRNIPAVRILDEVGVRNAADLVKRIGLPTPMAPFLPSALGATEEPLLAMVSAYSTFPNGGVRVEPTRIRKIVDRDGNELDKAEPKQYKVLSEYIAAQMVELMRGVVTGGTARAASSLGHPLGGKTGTVNDYTDAWFIGYDPAVTCGVWIGYSDSKKSLGKGEAGGSAALPFWIDFMRDYLKDKPKGKFPPTPDVPDELKPIIAERSHKHATELAKIAARNGDFLPGAIEPNLDPLGDPDSERKPNPIISRPTPQPIRDRPREEPREPSRIESSPKILRPPVESKPQKQEENERKGKKGRVNPE